MDRCASDGREVAQAAPEVRAAQVGWAQDPERLGVRVQRRAKPRQHEHRQRPVGMVAADGFRDGEGGHEVAAGPATGNDHGQR